MTDFDLFKLYKESNNYGKLLGLEIEKFREGEAVYKVKISEKHLATPIAAHGGVVAGMIDGTLGVAAMTIAAKNQNVVSTVDLGVSFIKPVRLGDELISTGTVISAGRRLIFTEAEVKNQNGVVVAKGRGTFNIYPAEKSFDKLNK